MNEIFDGLIDVCHAARQSGYKLDDLADLMDDWFDHATGDPDRLKEAFRGLSPEGRLAFLLLCGLKPETLAEEIKTHE